jgi:tetratricopeptide (TPR) repeat protein
MEPISQVIEVGQASGPEVDSAPGRAGLRPPSEELRASLAAVQAARAAARTRLRRDTRQIRVVSLALIAACAAGALAIAGHFRGRHRPARAPSLSAAAVPAVSSPDLGAAPTPAGQAAGAASTGATLPAPMALAAAPAVPVRITAPPVTAVAADAATAGPEGATTANIAQAQAACDQAYAGRRWPAATESCGRASELRPRDAALTMKVAQAYHARGRYAAAGDWARRALALDGVDPEALVILAHAERHAGHPAAARSAYRRYLVLAPRGWHAAEARAAVRVSERPRVRTGVESAAAALRRAPVASGDDANLDQR